MTCRNCGKESGHIVVRNGVESCHACGGFKESGGARTTGILSRNSLRIRQEAVMREVDTLHPFELDTARKKLVPSREFIKQYPGQAGEYFTDKQLLEAGHTKLPEFLKKRERKIKETVAKEEAKVRFVEGNQSVKQKEVLS